MKRISENEIQNLKAKYGLKKVYIVTFNDTVVTLIGLEDLAEEDEYPTLDFVFKKVGFDVLSASAAIGQDNPIKAIKLQMKSCLLWGDEDALFDPNDATVFTSVMQQFVKISEARTAQLKKN